MILRKIKFGIILGLILLITLPVTAQADIIWEEPTDSFYQEHQAECVSVNRSYVANGKVGYVAMYKSPTSKKKVKLYKNGYIFNFRYAYKDSKGKKWGLIELNKTIGWVPMKDVMMRYDNISFCEEYKDKFQKYNGEYDDELVDNSFYSWEYPCSGEIKSIDRFNSAKQIIYTYTNKNGNVWGLYKTQDGSNRLYDDGSGASKWNNYSGWICINDPNNSDIPAINHQADSIPAIKVLPSLKEVNTKSNMAFLLIGAMTLVISVTAGILVRVKMKKH